MKCDPYLKLLVEGNLIALWGLKNRNFGQEHIGFDTFWELIGQNEIWYLFEVTGRRVEENLIAW